MINRMLKKLDMFSRLSENELQKISDITTLKRLNESNILFYEGDVSDAFYILLEGKLKLYKMGIKSQELVLHYFVEPTMVAEMATFENINFPATAVAMENETVVAIIDKDKFLELLKKENDLSFHFMKSLTKKIRHLEVMINRNLIFDATTKVCSLLKENPNIFSTNKKNQVANILNMAPETLSRTVTKLKKLEILDKDNHIKKMEKLEMLLEFY